ncbi:class I SAM-dependent methyltransferase [Sphingomonas sp. AR_OL41]|uniref:class I SAM-dependent methyltransferase n=1 Tax=Sphingomonas sp. AR_OL41 TaxID=3042729 RepID=UPI0024808B9B|nr:class I SAM-dependent methyltransferase [Sphingomonas sp. AR_OL41]MDH7975035.1 class I SAM-dependent methyltransferase [Sphingomonas sp. AR_OL41]
MTFGSFIEPDHSVVDVPDLAERLECPIRGGYRAMDHAQHLLGRNRLFDAIWERSCAVPLHYEDQCSAEYYFDLVKTLRDFNGEFDHLVEVGAFMGGSSSIFAGCMERLDFTLDLVDIHPGRLRFSYERVRRLYPEAAARVRLFHGDLAHYVRAVMMVEPKRATIVHHDGSHEFKQVVKDMASLYYVRDQLFAVIAQDTHLRGSIESTLFVDMALYAVFGTDLKFAPIGAVYGAGDPLCDPNRYEGNYFIPGRHEGIVIPMSCNEFRYPHPLQSIDEFLPAVLDRAA